MTEGEFIPHEHKYTKHDDAIVRQSTPPKPPITGSHTAHTETITDSSRRELIKRLFFPKKEDIPKEQGLKKGGWEAWLFTRKAFITYAVASIAALFTRQERDAINYAGGAINYLLHINNEPLQPAPTPTEILLGDTTVQIGGESGANLRSGTNIEPYNLIEDNKIQALVNMTGETALQWPPDEGNGRLFTLKDLPVVGGANPQDYTDKTGGKWGMMYVKTVDSSQILAAFFSLSAAGINTANLVTVNPPVLRNEITYTVPKDSSIPHTISTHNVGVPLRAIPTPPK